MEIVFLWRLLEINNSFILKGYFIKFQVVSLLYKKDQARTTEFIKRAHLTALATCRDTDRQKENTFIRHDLDAMFASPQC